MRNEILHDTEIHQRVLPGIEEPSKVANVVGTEQLSGTTTGRGALLPEPSNDPNDPLANAGKAPEHRCIY